MSERRIERADAGPLTEALAAAAAVVLSILGLLGLKPATMVMIVTIVVGATFLLEAGAVGARYERLVDDVEQRGEQRVRATEVGGGLAVGTFAGVIGIALGVLALLKVVPWAMPPIALLAFGVGLLLSSAAARRLEWWRLEHAAPTDDARHEARRALDAITTVRVVAAVGAIVLAITALFHVAPAMLTLVGLLAVGGSLLSTGLWVGVPIVVARRHAAA